MNVHVHVKETALAVMLGHAQYAPEATEGCGLLVGRRYDSGSTIVDRVTEPTTTDRRTRHSYDLDEAFHIAEAERLAELHEAGGDILGSWHTHPQADPVPSPQDLVSWERVRAEDPTQVHVIVGTERVRVWRWIEGSWQGTDLWGST